MTSACQLELSPKGKKSGVYTISSHQQGFTVKEMRSCPLKDANKDFSHWTIERYLDKLSLKQSRNDLANGKVTREDVLQAIDHAHHLLLATSAGYRRMRQIVINSYQIHVPRYTQQFSLICRNNY
jgi:hypothetical protein